MRWQWVFRHRCGCPFGVREGRNAEPESVAWRDFYDSQRGRDVARDLGVTAELMTHDRYHAEVYPILRAMTSCPHRWLLRVPAPAPMLSANGNKPWQVTAVAKREWREAAYIHARKAKLPTGLNRVRVDVVLSFTSNRKRDSSNLHPYVIKPIVDALGPSRQVRDGHGGGRREPGYGLISDDTRDYLDGPYPLIGEAVPAKQYPLGLAVVHITDLSEEVARVG